MPKKKTVTIYNPIVLAHKGGQVQLSKTDKDFLVSTYGEGFEFKGSELVNALILALKYSLRIETELQRVCVEYNIETGGDAAVALVSRIEGLLELFREDSIENTALRQGINRLISCSSFEFAEPFTRQWEGGVTPSEAIDALEKYLKKTFPI